MGFWSVVSALVPSALGLLIVLQAGLNRKVAGAWGLPSAALLNAVVLTTVASVIFVFLASRSAALEPPYRVTWDWRTFSWWFLLPGMIGFVLVFGGPWAVAKWGAVHTFVLLIAAQLLGSLAWDLWVENRDVSRARILGLLLAGLGAWLSTWKA